MLYTTAYSPDQMVLISVPLLCMQFLVHVPSCCHNGFHSQNCSFKVQGSKYHIDVWKVSSFMFFGKRCYNEYLHYITDLQRLFILTVSINDHWLIVTCTSTPLHAVHNNTFTRPGCFDTCPTIVHANHYILSHCHNGFPSQKCPLKVQGSKYHIDVWKVSRLSCFWEEISQWVFTLHHMQTSRDHLLLHCEQKPMIRKVYTSSLHTIYTQQTICWCTCDNFDFALHATFCIYTFLLSQQFPFPKLPFEDI